VNREAVGGGSTASDGCPLCGHERASTSWIGTIRFDGRDYSYLECSDCRSLYCSPMPDEATLSRMYGMEYSVAFPDTADADPKDHERVMAWLRQRPAGVFIDYGCGSGELLGRATQEGWEAIGVELDARVADAAASSARVRVVTSPADLPDGVADAVHLGDVIEHLTRLDEQMPRVLKLLKPGGHLLAQGPLEANGSLFAATVRFMRRLKGRPTVDMAPYHVLLATAVGQRLFFQRLGLVARAYDVTETAWPAPERLVPRDLGRPRRLALYAVRRLSQRVSRFRPGHWGNRYFYIGGKAG